MRQAIKRTSIVIALLAVGAVVACGGTGGDDDPPVGVAAPTTGNVEETDEYVDETEELQKPIEKEIGQMAGLGCTADSIDSCVVTFRVTEVTDCTTSGYHGDPPPDGTHRKLVWIEVETTEQYPPDEVGSYLLTTFTAETSDGVTTGGELNPSTFWDCVPEHQSIIGDQDWRPGKKYAGAVEVYLPDDAVKLINGEGLFEWSLE